VQQLLLALRVALHERIAPLLARAERLLSRGSGQTVAWVLSLVGLYLVWDALPVG